MMTETNITPGPWKVRKHGYMEGCDVYQDGKHGTRFVAYTGPQNVKDYPESCLLVDQANARLIAASPEMYDVLERLEESTYYWSEYDVPLGIVDDIKTILKKARGENETLPLK